MKKLSLDLRALRVETFATAEAEAARGTVQAQGYTEAGSCAPTCGNPPATTTLADDAVTDPRMCCL